MFLWSFLKIKGKRGMDAFRVWMLLFCIGGINFIQKKMKDEIYLKYDLF